MAQNSADDVVVSRGDATITLRDIDAWVQRVPKDQREKFIDSPTRIRDMLNNLLLTKQLAAQARAAHLEDRPDNAAQLRAVQDEALARMRSADFMANIKVPDLSELVAEYYATHKDQYRIPPVVDVKHVLISTEGRPDEDAKALAEKVHAEAVAKPDAFDALVEQYSDDASKTDNHGLIKDATNDKLVKPFRDAAGALTKVGQISPIVRTTFGYHVLEAVAVTPGRQQTFAEVKDKATAAAREQYIDTQRRDFFNGLNNEKLDINPATLDTLRDRYDVDGNVRVAGAPADGSAPPATPAAKQP